MADADPAPAAATVRASSKVTSSLRTGTAFNWAFRPSGRRLAGGNADLSCPDPTAESSLERGNVRAGLEGARASAGALRPILVRQLDSLTSSKRSIASP